MVVIEVDPIRALSAAMEGYRVLTAAEAAPIGDVFLTATGDIHIFRAEHFEVMKDGVILANAGHFDVEIDLEGLGELAVAKRHLRDNLDEYELADGRRIVIVAEGRLVNLGAAEGHPADVMDMSFADQALAAEWLVNQGDGLSSDVHILPREIDEEVARLKLESMGASLETLTSEQEQYLSSWETGT